MEEKDILLKTIEGLNASIALLSATNKDQAEQIKNLRERIKELTAQIAWLNRQLFGRMHIPADTRSAFPVISVHSPVSIQCRWQS